MHIQDFHIDSFGLFQHITLKNLPSNFAIFLGKNEAGKSTLLDFFRYTLMGYPQRRRSHTREYTNAGGQQGGSLLLHTSHGPIRLTRRPKKTGLILTDHHGNHIDDSLWEKLLHGITRDVYTNIYGFSLTELQSFETVNTNDIRNALYGASFGTGLHSPSEVIKSLENTMSTLFKPSGSNQPIAQQLKEWEEITKKIKEIEQDVICYDAYSLELQNLKTQMLSLQDEIKTLEQQYRTLKRHLAIWDQWEEWQLIDIRLKSLYLEPLSKTFPQDALVRLDHAIREQKQAVRGVALATTRLDNVSEKIHKIHIDEKILEKYEELHSLAEYKSSYQTALKNIPVLHNNLKQTSELLHQKLKSLGDDWSVEKVQKIHRPLHIREQLETLSTDMQIANETYHYTTNNLTKITKDLEIACQQEEVIKKYYESFATPLVKLDDTTRDKLNILLIQAEKAAVHLPEKQRTRIAIHEDLKKRLTQLHLQPYSHHIETLKRLLSEQDTAMAMVKKIEEKNQETNKALSLLEQAQQTEEQSQTLLKQLSNQLQQLDSYDQTKLDTKRAKLRNLRSLLNMLSVEEARIEETQEDYQLHLTHNPTKKNIFTIPISGLCSLIGGGIIASQYTMDITHIQLSSTITLPLSLWSGYLFLLTGIALITTTKLWTPFKWGNNTYLMHQLQSRYEKATEKYTRTHQNIHDICAELSIEKPSIENLDSLEYEIEKERDIYLTKERLQQEYSKYQKESDLLHSQVCSTKDVYQQQLSELQTANNTWYEYLLSFGVQQPPPMDQVTTFFVRIETAYTTLTTLHILEKELADLETQQIQLTEFAQNVLPDHLSPSDWNSISQVITTVRTFLDSYKKDTILIQKRTQTLEELHTAKIQRQHLTQLLQKAQEEHQLAQSNIETKQNLWHEYVTNLKLDPKFSPATVRKALECMDTIEALHAEYLRIQADLKQQKREQEALILPLQHLAIHLRRSPINNNWLMFLDDLIKEAKQASLLENEKKALEIQQDEYTHEVKQAQILLNDANQNVDKLLKLGEVTDTEIFRQKATIKQEIEELCKKSKDLEDILKLHAKDIAPEKSTVDFEKFLQAFSETEKKDIETTCEETSLQLTHLNEKKEYYADQARTLELRLENLASSDTLAQMRLQESAILSSIQDIAKKWSSYALAKQLLVEAKSHFEKERQPKVIRTASKIFASITDKKWIGISSSLDDMSLKVLPDHGEPVNPETLSRGTQEQLYLSLRLAHIHNHAIQASPLPIIMDDILVNFDPERIERTIKAFINLTLPPSEGTMGHQILFFTCHPHIATQLLKVTPGSVLYTIEDRTISTIAS